VGLLWRPIAKENPGRKTRAVEEQMHTSHRNASRWIAEARKLGFLTEENV
jgi:hypothetical protein